MVGVGLGQLLLPPIKFNDSVIREVGIQLSGLFHARDSAVDCKMMKL